MLSRYLSLIVEIWKCLCVLSRYLSLIVEIWKCLCVVSLSQPYCRDLDYPLWNVHGHEIIKKCKEEEKISKCLTFYL